MALMLPIWKSFVPSVDIPAAALLRHPPPELFTPTPRGIHSTNPRECAIYISKLHDYLQSHNVFNRTERLSRWTTKHGMTDRLSRQWEALDRDITAACIAAERRTGSHDRAPWSPKLHQAHLRVLFWRITVRQLLRNNDPSTAVAHIRSQLQHPSPPIVYDLHRANLHIKLASKELHQIRTAAATHRQQHLEERAAIAAATQNADSATIIKRIIQAENTKAAYRILRKYLHSEAKGNIGEIEIQNEDGTTTLIEEPVDIFRRILQRDQIHFRQAEGTPFTTQPLQQFLGIAGETPAAQEFLRTGNLTLDFQHATLPETITLLRHMKSFPVRIPHVNTTITAEDYRKFFRKWKETTSTSDKRHLGHWKALVSDLPADDPNYKKAQQIIQTIVTQLNLSAKHGYAWKRWRRIISAKIPKRAGILRLDQLRTINLFEPDFNWLLGMLFGKRMLRNTHTFRLLHDSQYGSRPGRHALGAVFMKLLSYEICRITRTPLASFDNDAKSCYDRIIIAMAMLLCQRAGMPVQACLMAAICLQQAQYYVKTKFGISTSFYRSTEESPTHGPGQGSRMGPVLWLLISCLLFAAMASLCQGATFCNPQNSIQLQRTGDGFVDDVTNVCNFGFPNSLLINATPQTLAAQLQREAQTWERLLWSAGGALELNKCFYYILSWKFRHDGHPLLLLPPQLHGCNIQLTSGISSDLHTIQHKPCNVAHRTLGVWMAPTGTSETQATQCLQRSQQITKGLRNNRLTRTQAWMAYRHIWLPSVGYPLACSSLTTAQLSKIQNSAIRDFLPHLGFARSFPRAVLYGPTQFGGFGLRTLHAHQGIEQIILFLQHYRLQDSPGKLLRMTLDWYQHYCGMSFPLFAAPCLSVPHAPEGWLSSCRAFLAHCGGRLMITSEWVRLPKPLRQSDKILMNEFTTLNLKPKQLKILNYCRLYLQVECLSEICSLDGSHILPAAWNGLRLPSRSRLHWPIQTRPRTWSLWKNSLARLFLRNPLPPRQPRPADLALSAALGAWYHHHSEFRKWPSYATHAHLFLLQHDDRYRILPRDILPTDRRWLSFRRQTPVRFSNHPPPDVAPSPIIKEMHSHFRTPELRDSVLAYSFPVSPTDANPRSFLNLSSYLQTLPEWERLLLSHYTSNPASHLSLSQFLSSPDPVSTLYLVSDGSSCEPRGSFGWALADSTSNLFFSGHGNACGWSPSSFRSEAYGALAVFRFLTRYLQYHALSVERSAIQVKFYCDNQGLIQTLHRTFFEPELYPKDMIRADYDVIITILRTIQALPFSISFHHVKGHQDSTPNRTLSWEATLNVLCDRLANNALRSSQPVPLVPPTAFCPVQLVLDDKTITSFPRSHLTHHSSRSLLLAYLKRRHAWTDQIIDLIQWNAHRSAFNHFTLAHRPFLCKLIHRHLPLGKRLASWTHDYPTICPTCQHADEDFAHFLACPGRQTWTIERLFRLNQDLQRLRTAPHLRRLLMIRLRTLLLPQATEQLFPQDGLLSLSQEQSQIGWMGLVTGHFSTKWETLQAQFNPRSAAGWQAKVISNIWRMLQDLWTLRNTHLHVQSPSGLDPVRDRILLAQVQDLYDLQPALAVHDQALYPTTLQEATQLSRSVLTTWKNMTIPALDAAILSLAE